MPKPVVLGAASLLFVAGLVSYGQSSGSPTFEVASLKPSDPKLGRQLFPVQGGAGDIRRNSGYLP
jgi:hypothetical protein